MPRKPTGRPNGQRGPDKRQRKRRAGGNKPGPGRPPGSKNDLPGGAVGAIKAMRWRVPEEVPEEIATVADEAFERIVDVMHGRAGPFGAFSVLGAARTLREEICGRVAQPHAHSGSVTLVVDTGVPRPPGDADE